MLGLGLSLEMLSRAGISNIFERIDGTVLFIDFVDADMIQNS